MYEEDENWLDDETIEKASPWLVTFGDVTALMLTFFVMLYSMSTIESERWEVITSLLSSRIVPDEVGEPVPDSPRNSPVVQLVPAKPVSYLLRILEPKLARDPYLDDAIISGFDSHVVISLPSGLLFGNGGITLSDAAREAIERLAIIFDQFGNQIDVRGHTNPNPPSADGLFPNNWQLSLARAVVVAEALQDAGYPASPTVLGLGDSRFRYLDPSIPVEQRMELADRVDLVIMPNTRRP